MIFLNIKKSKIDFFKVSRAPKIFINLKQTNNEIVNSSIQGCSPLSPENLGNPFCPGPSLKYLL